ncbi:MAG: GTPase [Planctomycetota bacterium]
MTAEDDPLEQLADDLAALDFVGGADADARFRGLQGRARRLLAAKLRLEAVRGPDDPPLVVIAGGTNVGKSTIFNWVVGEAVASSSPLARHTKAPTVYVHERELRSLHGGAFLPGYERLALTAREDPARERAQGRGAEAYFLLTHARDELAGVVLVDSPDIDSTHARNREVAEDLLFLADAVLFVATPEKYNDALCVDYMRQAVRLAKGLLCVLNKGADPEVARDLREGILPELAPEAPRGGEPPGLLELPYTPRPDPATQAAFRGELAEAVLRPRQGGAALRARAEAGARAELARALEQLIARQREELSELYQVRSEVALVLFAARDEYERFLSGVEFFELDLVYERVLQEFRIPVLDHVYDGLRSGIGWISGNIGRLVSGRAPEDSRHQKLDQRAERDRLKIKELLGTARLAVSELPERHTQVLREAATEWVEGLGAPEPAQLNAQIEDFHERAHAASERWIEEQTRMHVELIEQHPRLKVALRTVKGVLQVGFGLLSAKLTGGFGPWDVLIGTAAQAAVKPIIEAAGGHVQYQKLKADFLRERGALFGALLEESVGRPLAERLPQGVEPARLERLEEALEGLRERKA